MSLSAHHFQTNRLDLLSRLAGDISHEVKNPLHAMVINLELVRRKVEKGEAKHAIERVTVVEEEIRKVHALTAALLETLRPPRDSHTTCNLARVFQEIAPLVQAQARCARVDLKLDIEPTTLAVPLAAHDARLLILNLADRAIRVAGSTGSIGMALRVATESVAVEVTSDAPAVDDIEVSWLNDHPVDAERIDLGLRVVRDLVRRASGRIHAGAAMNGSHRLLASLPGTASA